MDTSAGTGHPSNRDSALSTPSSDSDSDNIPQNQETQDRTSGVGKRKTRSSAQKDSLQENDDASLSDSRVVEPKRTKNKKAPGKQTRKPIASGSY